MLATQISEKTQTYILYFILIFSYSSFIASKQNYIKGFFVLSKK